MNENIEKMAVNVATLGPIGRMPFGFGSIVASLAALPVWFLLHRVFNLTTLRQLIVTLIIIGILMVITQFALGSDFLRRRSDIVIDSIAGLLIALFSMPFWFKLLAFGFVLYHFIHFLQRFFMFKGIFARLNTLPGVLAVFVDDMIVGLLVNMFLALMLWIMH